jgi:hypothetical protein
MLDPVGLIASVITIAQVVTEGVKRAKTCYRAQEEFEALQVSVTIGALILSLSPPNLSVFGFFLRSLRSVLRPMV